MLDLEDPCRVIGHLREPLLSPVPILTGSVVLAICALLVVLWKARRPAEPVTASVPVRGSLRILLAADGDAAAGLMLQQLPGSDGDADGWNRASILFDTLSPAELLAWDAGTLLQRLFHEESPQAMGGRELRFGCSCSRERVSDVLRTLGPEEATAAVIDGVASVRCEFCGQAYQFRQADIDALFTGEQAPLEAPPGLQ